MTFTLPIKILFQHCDPAGIVFYPRYFEMINLTVEEWFEQSLGYSFASMQDGGNGVPAVTIQTEFTAPSRLGEILDFELIVTRLGKTSVALKIIATAGSETRLKADLVLVHIVKRTGRPTPWHEGTKAKIAAFVA